MLRPQGAGQTGREAGWEWGSIPVVAALAECPRANALLVGIAPPGGKLPPRGGHLLGGRRRRMTVISGMHEFLADDRRVGPRPPPARRAELIDLRRNDERDVANRQGHSRDCLRIHTIGNDCSCGKMVAAVEVAAGVRRVPASMPRSWPPGQTGILVAGGGCPIDRVIGDFRPAPPKNSSWPTSITK